MRNLIITTDKDRFGKNWTRSEITWPDFVERLKTPRVGQEYQAEFMKMDKKQQDTLKDVGGFVAGAIDGPQRLSNNCLSRSMITLDLDDIPSWSTEKVLEQVEKLACAAAVYSTRKHKPSAPRLRIIIPLDRDATPEEYAASARKVASMIGIDMCDSTTFDINRLMFWPSRSFDGEYIFREFDGPFCGVGSVLGMYGNWHDASEWPTAKGEDAAVLKDKKKQGNPLEKENVVGAFCRTYDIYEAMENFLPGVYLPTDKDNRFTYAAGSTHGGVLIYDDGLFLYSNHNTDPCNTGRHCVNAFDMVRLHKFGHLDLDAKEGTPGHKLPSYAAMIKFATSDDKVRDTLAQEQGDAIVEAFGNGGQYSQLPDDYSHEWIKGLKYDDEHIKILRLVSNMEMIITNDIDLRGRIWFDEFSERIMAVDPVPWPTNSCDDGAGSHFWTDADEKGIYKIIELKYYWLLEGRKPLRSDVEDAVKAVAMRNKRNPVKDFILTEEWDGVKRLETQFIEAFGAEDSEYTRAVTKKMFTAAVARIFEPGCKFDNMVILNGGQGIGKSTYFQMITHGPWFSDSLNDFDTKEGMQQIQGIWIAEIGELDAMNKKESNSVKRFLSSQKDWFRPSYGKNVEPHPRRCILVGTTNDDEYLKDETGNRRFWPIECGATKIDQGFFERLEKDIYQIWAEAVVYYRLGEPLYLSEKLAAKAAEVQKRHVMLTGQEEAVQDFLDQKIPSNWYDLSIDQQKMALSGGLKGADLVERDRVTIGEIWTLCYNRGNVGSMSQRDRLAIGKTLRNVGWIPKHCIRFGSKVLRGYERPTTRDRLPTTN